MKKRINFIKKKSLEWNDGTKFWYKEGLFHREDGPAIEYSNGDKEWYKEGIRHREDGPAVEFNSGTKYWFYNSNIIKCNSTEEFIKLIKLKVFW